MQQSWRRKSPHKPSFRLGRVAFFVNKTIPDNEWAVDVNPEEQDLVACLRIKSSAGHLRIHNVHNRLQWIDIERLVKTCSGPSDIVLGDFNSHHPLWGGHNMRQQTDSSGKALAK
ncbi:hypothetical protein CONLIGDRAFT_684004 [Coniochaeta ligniaria NRRL 30616]|uniref:Uncharacterized protein n=1 Tax=Coniochaeta ligniaria NRRL 30616 TaxID=1408157 RepID=A0A1J7IHZ2_9PEZI|nr:hypothetical protein CONLIGDRAFT_684004 [Coniochaeta ligniaria NRRL 30616]